MVERYCAEDEFMYGGKKYKKTKVDVFVDDDGKILYTERGKICKNPKHLRNKRNAHGNIKKYNQMYEEGKLGAHKDIVYKHPEALRVACEEYFAKTEKQTYIKTNGKGEKLSEVPYPFTLQGLVNHLGITRKTFNGYRKERYRYVHLKEEDGTFKDVALWAINRIEDHNLTYGYLGGYDGRLCQFDFKNLDPDHYKDKVEHTNKNDNNFKIEIVTVPPKADGSNSLESKDSNQLNEGRNGFSGEIIEAEEVLDVESEE
jgi:hypothetical protein